MMNEEKSAAGPAASVFMSSVSASFKLSMADINSRMLARFKQPTTKVDAALPTGAPILPQTSNEVSMVDLTSHCLVLDGRHFVPGSADALHMDGALALGNNPAALVQHMHTWMPAMVVATLHLAYTEVAHRRVHLNFTSQSDLAAALSTLPLLARCGSLSHVRWAGVPLCCGKQQHEQPEMLQLSCVPSTKGEPNTLPAAITALLTYMQLVSTSHWHPTSSDPTRNGMARIVINVLPRHCSHAELATTVTRLHGQYRLWGGTIHVQAPNTPSLTRCRGCHELGHVQEQCPQYSGLGFRLLFKKPVSHLAMQQIRTRLLARAAYLGSGCDQFAPHRKLTLLFDGDESDPSTIEPILQRMHALIDEVRSALHESPCMVRPRDRQRECKHCNSILREHSCPFDTETNRGGQRSFTQQQHTV